MDSSLSLPDSASTLQSGGKIIRTSVMLPNGTRILVPISEDATVKDLHVKAVLRGSSIMRMSTLTVETSMLKLSGSDAAHLWEGEMIIDVVDDPEQHTFFLAPSTAQHLSTPIPDDASQYSDSASTQVGMPNKGDLIYIRWITPETALDTRYHIQSIPADPNPLPLTTSVDELKTMAYEKLLAPRIAKEELPSNAEAVLYLDHCKLNPADAKTISLGFFGQGISIHRPLNIFVVPVVHTTTKKARDAFAFKVSDRAASTFLTCLQTVMVKVAPKQTDFQSFQRSFWEVSHFPPAVLALRELYDGGIKSMTSSCAVFAYCFRKLCLNMFPETWYGAQDNVLTVSRQVFAWLFHVNSSPIASLTTPQSLVHTVEIRKANNSTSGDTNDTLDNAELVQLPADDKDANLSAVFPRTEQFWVLKDQNDTVSFSTLAAALSGGPIDEKQYYFSVPADLKSIDKHRKAKIPTTRALESLLEVANESKIFKMFGPMDLSQCPTTELPIITLDSAGYTSLYNQRTFNCDDRYWFTENIVRGEERLTDTESGQFLLSKLEPIMEQRRKDGTWKIDSWSSDAVYEVDIVPDEAVVFVVDESSSMKETLGSTWGASLSSEKQSTNDWVAFAEVREMFTNTVVRMTAYRLPMYLGLVTFSSSDKIHIRQGLSVVLPKMKDALKGIEPGGSTALWDAISTAHTMLKACKLKHPKTKLRIVAFTDGENNASKSTPAQVCKELLVSNVVLDAIVIGSHTTDLFKMAKFTGGYAFHPQSRMALFQIFLLENFLDIKARPDISRPVFYDFATAVPKAADLRDIFDCPPCRPHANQDDEYIPLELAYPLLSRVGSRTSKLSSTASSITSSTVSNPTRILLNQVKSMVNNPHPYFDVYVSERNMGYWKVVMQGPPDSLYKNGTFLLSLEMGDNFPASPPQARFLTPILHPNISKHGRICHPIFDRKWEPSLTVSHVLQTVWSILLYAEASDALDPISTTRYYDDPEVAKPLIDQYITKFALKTREQHRQEIAGDCASSTMSGSTLLTPTSSVKSSISLPFRRKSSGNPPMAQTGVGAQVIQNLSDLRAPSIASDTSSIYSSSTITSLGSARNQGTGGAKGFRRLFRRGPSSDRGS